MIKSLNLTFRLEQKIQKKKLSWGDALYRSYKNYPSVGDDEEASDKMMLGMWMTTLSLMMMSVTIMIMEVLVMMIKTV